MREKWFRFGNVILQNLTMTAFCRDHWARSSLASVLEQLTVSGIISDGGRARVFERRFTDMCDESPVIGMYLDRSDNPSEEGEARWLLEDLRQAVAVSVPAANRIKYEVRFRDGINLHDQTHLSYLRRLLDDLCTAGLDAIDTTRRSPALCIERDRLVEESCLHLAFAAERAKRFSATGPSGEALTKVTDYLSGRGGHAMVVHGPSGAGKTYVMAKAAAFWAQHMLSQSTMVLRFLGTSQDSATVAFLLRSLCEQLRSISMGKEAFVADCSSAKEGLGPVPADFDALCTYFRETLANWRRPQLLLLLDSVDQLDDTNAGRRLEWLPLEFSEQVLQCSLHNTTQVDA